MRDRAGHLIGQRLDHQRMCRINIVVVNHQLRASTARFANRPAECLTLQKIEVEGGGNNENFTGSAAVEYCGQSVDGGQRNIRRKTENGLASSSDCARVPALYVACEDEGGCQRSFPPIRPCLVMVASTSTMARTATSAVMSEMS